MAEALFDEWEAELDQYTSAPLRRSSERRLQETRAQYGQLLRAMKRAEAKMAAVLAAFHDQVLFLKHTRLADREAMVSVASGWHTPVGLLIDILNGHELSGFWSTHARLRDEYEKRIAPRSVAS